MNCYDLIPPYILRTIITKNNLFFFKSNNKYVIVLFQNTIVLNINRGQ